MIAGDLLTDLKALIKIAQVVKIAIQKPRGNGTPCINH